MMNVFHKCGLVWVTLCLIGAIEAEDKMVTVSNVTVKVLERSGTILIYTGTDDSKAVQIKLDFLTEVDTDGDDIPGKHSVQEFASETFTLTDPVDETYGLNDVPVSQFSFVAMLDVDGDTSVTFMSFINVFKGDGDILVDGENVTVKSSDVQFSVKVENWPFCGTGSVICNKGQGTAIGEYLDLGIEMKGRNDEAPTLDSGSTYNLGNDAKLIVPKLVTYDNTTSKDMPTGYPKLVTKDNKQIFKFRFEKFATSVLYEPFVSMVTNEDSGDDDGNAVNDALSVTMSESDIHVNVLKKSGTMSIMLVNRAVQIVFYKISEVTDTGTAIITDGHAVNAFDDQAFTFSTEESATLQDLEVKKITFATDLSNAAKLTVNLYMFKEDGNFTNGDEKFMVEKGTVKFTIEVTGWKFCGDTGVTCTQEGENEVGSHLDFEMKVTGSTPPSEHTIEISTGKLYDVGTALVNFFSEYQKDGSDTFTSMPTDYPSYSKQGTNHIFTMRFEKFTSLVYDPVVTMVPDKNGGTVAMATFMTYLCALLCFVFNYL